MSTSLPEQSASAAFVKKGQVKTRSLIDGELWDSYHLESLLPLKETYRENTEFGFLLRHYWSPATILTFRQSSKTTFPGGRVEQYESKIERKMARCRSNECLWRDKIHPIAVSATSSHSPFEVLCSYDCYEQTYVSANPIRFAPPTSEQRMEARRQALYRLPLLCPPGPLPIGFSWHAKVDGDYMNYHLKAEVRLGETSVLIIRREGCYTTWLPKARTIACDEEEVAPVVVERKGITFFAWNRGVVLEDRVMDCMIDTKEHSDLVVGTTNQAVTRLIRSCPEGLARQAPPTSIALRDRDGQ